MVILYICTKDPREICGGNEQRTNLLWNALQQLGKVYTIVYEGDGPETPCYIDDTNRIVRCSTYYRSYYKTLKGIGYTVLDKYLGFGFLPYKFPLRYKPDEIFPGVKFDIVVTRYINMPAKYHFWDIAPLYVDIDDHPVQVFDTSIKSSFPRVIQCIFRKILLKQYGKLVTNFAGGWLANKSLLSSRCPNISYLPNIPLMPGETYNPRSDERNYLFTIGKMSYPPNYLGVDRFLNEIWPHFHHKYPKVVYRIGGKGAPEEFAERWMNKEGVEYCGFIPNLEDAYEQCIATIVPIYSGGGTCIKTLESLAFSRLCLSTRFGVRGIEEDDINKGNGLFVFEDSDTFIGAYEEILHSSSSEKERKAFDYISKGSFSKDRFEKSVINVIEQKN